MSDQKPNNSTGEGDESTPTDGERVDPLAEIAARLAEFKAFASHFTEVKVDQARLWLRNMLVAAIGMFFVGLAATFIVSISAIYVARGSALGIASLFGDELWIGYLLAGLILWLLVALIGMTWFAIQTHRRKRELIEKYETRRNDQDAELGTNADHFDANTGSAAESFDSRIPEAGIQRRETGDARLRSTDA